MDNKNPLEQALSELGKSLRETLGISNTESTEIKQQYDWDILFKKWHVVNDSDSAIEKSLILKKYGKKLSKIWPTLPEIHLHKLMISNQITLHLYSCKKHSWLNQIDNDALLDLHRYCEARLMPDQIEKQMQLDSKLEALKLTEKEQ